MRDYNKIADRVFRRRDEYLEEKKRKKAVYIKRFSVALSCCIVLMLGLGIWKMDLLRRIAPDDGDYHDAPPVTTTSVSTDIGISTETTARTTASADTTTTFAAVTSDGSGTTSAAATSAADTTASTTARTTAQERPSAVTTAPRTTASGSEEHIRTTSQSPRTTTTTHRGESGALPTTTKTEVTSTPRTTSRHITTTTRPRTTTTTRIHTTRTTTRVAVITTTTVPVFTQPPVTSTRWGLTTTATTTTAYFAVGEPLTLNINYTAADGAKSVIKDIAALTAATDNTITLATNQNGLISLTITYNDTFTEGTSATYTFDAATGNEITPAP